MRGLVAANAWDRSALDCHRGTTWGNTMSRSRREFLMTSGAALLSPAPGRSRRTAAGHAAGVRHPPLSALR